MRWLAENRPEAGRERDEEKEESMNDIERLEKYIRQRNKWSKWELRPQDTDMQRLRSQEMNTWFILIMIYSGLMGMIEHPVFPRALHLTAAAFFLVTLFVFSIDLRRTGILVEIFQRTAIQKAEDVLCDIKKRNANPTQQDTPAS